MVRRTRNDAPTVPETAEETDATQRALYKTLHLKKRAFLLAYIEAGGRISRACAAVGLSRQAHYLWLETDSVYKAAFESARDTAADLLEEEATRRALDGVPRPVYQGGVKVGEVMEYSDTLLIFLLKAARPDKYRERTSTEHTGAGGGPLLVSHFTEEVNRVYGPR